MGDQWRVGPALTLLFVLWACSMPASAQAPLDIQAILARVGARVQDYYRRAQRLICTESATVLPIEPNWTPSGMARTVNSELRLEMKDTDGDGDLEATITRTIESINGRPPRERDKTDQSGCTDPNPLSPEPLEFLVPGRDDGYQFTSLKNGKEDGRAAVEIDFTSTGTKSAPELVDRAGGHDDCFDWTGRLGSEGRVWVDAETYDVLRVDRHIFGPVSIRVPRKLQQRYGFGDWIVLDRDDLTLRYRRVAFTNPDEDIVLPSSVDETMIVHDGLQSARRSDTFSDYHRFLTNGHIVRGGR